MGKLETIQQVEEFIYNFSLFKDETLNQNNLIEKFKYSEKIALQFNNKKLLVHTRICMTDFYFENNDVHTALNIAVENKLLAEQENLEEEQLNCYSGLLKIFYHLGDYSSLEELIYIYREKLLNSNNLNKLCSLYIFSAIQYYNLKEQTKCVEAYKKALEYALEINNTELLIHVYNNYGFHVLHYNLDLSYELLTKCLQLIENSNKDDYQYNLAAVNINLAEAYFLKNDYRKCNKCLDIAINISKTLKNNNLLLETEDKLCELFIKTGKFELAKKILLRNEKNCVETDNKHLLLNTYNYLQKVYKKTDEYKLAYEYLFKYQNLKNDIFNEESIQKIKNIQISNEVKDIKIQRDHAEKIAKLKHDFLANMSHEIRTPINSVLGICYLIQQDNLSKKQLNYIKRLEKSSENLLNLINEILDLSKIEAEKLELVPVQFSYNSILQDVTQSLQYKAKEKGIELILNTTDELDQLINGDAQRLSQILINLIANAIKFTNNGYVKIYTSIINTAAEISIISCNIEDTGIGIAEDNITTIFERYEQATPTIKTQFGGTGLGLAISKKLTELMNGQILVKSEINKGTIFTINIPFNLNNKIEIAERTDLIINTSFLDDIDFIIADDIEESRLVIKEILQHFNNSIHVKEAKNGKEVLELFETKIPDILLIDLDMPILNGIDTVIEIRKTYSTTKTKIIAYTASLITLTTDEILKIGFDALLIKPFKPNTLLQKLLDLK